MILQMRKALSLLILLSSMGASFAQEKTNLQTLKALSFSLNEQFKKDSIQLFELVKQKKAIRSFRTENGSLAQLTGIAPNRLPEYTVVDNNTNAAATTSTQRLWQGGSTGLGLTGGIQALSGKLGIWDGGRVFFDHVEFQGKNGVQLDNPGANDDHATHVAGTMVAKGMNTVARGMAYGNRGLIAYDFNNDAAEMATQAGSLLLSNHSYGTIAGWRVNTSANNRWEFWGEPGANEDYNFGFYDTRARFWDSITYAAPFYLPVKSSGNNRSQNGPPEGSPYWRRNAAGTWDSIPARPAGISSNDGYDIISTYGNAKNILTIGAVSAIPSGYQQASDVLISTFSSWGPTDDGRIKPDLVGMGVSLTSSVFGGNITNLAAYGTLSGTSMSTPNVTGSLLLLQELYHRQTEGNFMRAATLKGIAIHTASEAGTTAGPDYVYGWGLLNAEQAANVIRNQQNNHRIIEATMQQGRDTSITVIASGKGPLVLTLTWTDPPGTVNFADRYNNRSPKLINDLDIRVTSGSNTFQPWILDPANPAAPATRGDNVRDNVEKIEIPNAVAGQSYTIRISHKGTLINNLQAYSLIASGINGIAYCASTPASNADSRINNLTFGTINNTPPTGCTTYSDYTSLTASIRPGQLVPISITPGTCGVNKDKIIRVFIDWNGDGDFEDSNEIVATSGVIAGSTAFTTNVQVPASIVAGMRTRMRVVLAETTNAAGINACGTYTGGGETQDYSLQITANTTDLALEDIQEPISNDCNKEAQYVSLRVRNLGETIVQGTDIAYVTEVRQGATLIQTLRDTIRHTVAKGDVMILPHSQAFQANGGSYQFVSTIGIAGDQNSGNNSLTVSKTYSTGLSATVTNIQAQVCNNTSVSFRASVNPATGLLWYTQQTGGMPIGGGTAALASATVPANRIFYVGVNDFKGNIGINNKEHFGSGGYNQFSPGVRIQTFTPVEIESARLYVGNSGKITIMVVDSATMSIVATTSLELKATSPSPSSGAQANQPEDMGRVYPLNLRIPQPGNYVIKVDFGPSATLYRNNSIPLNQSPYPIITPGVMAITGHEATVTTTQFYYYFYDMRVRSLDCAGTAGRTAVTAAAPLNVTITQTGNNLASSTNTGSIQWFFNNNPITGGTGQNLNIGATGSGIYRVRHGLLDCLFQSADLNATITALNVLSAERISLQAGPNPVKGVLNVRYTSTTVQPHQVELFNQHGNQLYQERYASPGTQAVVNRQLKLGELAAGVYVLKLTMGKEVYLTKVIAQ
jgi:hypothetical protein